MSEDTSERNARIAEIAAQFLTFIDVQTGTAPPAPEEVGESDMLQAFVALDEALDQLADLADVYGTDRMQSIEPLVLPAAALVGEYLRFGAGATWVEPIIDADTTLVIATPDGIAVDLTGAVRASLFSGMANLKIMVDRMINPEIS
ncbi:MAG: hypothetical protein R3A46_01090 [Thermomicrobiales bacterium]